jgi:ribose 5-phosphate isomerase RpiB
MNRNSDNRNSNGSADVLRWPGKIVTAEGLRQSLNGERQLAVVPGTVITPSAVDHLKANGVSLVRGEASPRPHTEKKESKSNWGFLSERSDPVVSNVVQALKRDGVDLQEIQASAVRTDGKCETAACGLARRAAEIVTAGECKGVVIFGSDPGLACCIANKVQGIRATAVASAAQAGRAVNGLGANVLTFELGKMTFFEMRQILRCVCGSATCCSEVVAQVIQELEGPCHCQRSDGNSGQESGRKECKCGGNHAHR